MKWSFLDLCSSPMCFSGGYISTKGKLSEPVRGHLREEVDWDVLEGQTRQVS